MDWPPQIPDLKIIEAVWDRVVRKDGTKDGQRPK